MVLGTIMVLQVLTRDDGLDEDEAERAGLKSEIMEKTSMNSFIIIEGKRGSSLNHSEHEIVYRYPSEYISAL